VDNLLIKFLNYFTLFLVAILFIFIIYYIVEENGNIRDFNIL